VLTAFAAGIRGPLAILREVARIMLSTAAAMAVLTALASGFRCPFAVVGEIARAVLSAGLAGTRCLFAILSEIARAIPCRRRRGCGRRNISII